MQYAENQHKCPLTPSQRAQILREFERFGETVPNVSQPDLFSQMVTFGQISTYCLLTVFPETSLIQKRSSRVPMLFRGVLTPPLMPAGADAQQMLDQSSMSAVIVIVIAGSL